MPSSGAAQGFKGDIRASKEGKTMLFEVKNHSNVFAKIYDLYFDNIKLNKDDKLSIAHDTLCIDVSTSLSAVLESGGVYRLAAHQELFKRYSRTYRKIIKMQELVKECDVLVLKDNNKPFLFLRYS